MHARDYLIILLLATTLILYIGNFVCKKITKRWLKRHVIKIKDGKETKCIFQGTILEFSNQRVISPLSKHSCYGYLYFVLRRNDDELMHFEDKPLDFLIDDGTGKCRVSAQSAGTFYDSKEWPPIIKFSDYVSLEDAALHNDLVDKPGSKKYRHMEYRRQIGEPVYVEGMFKPDTNTIVNDNNVKVTITPAYDGECIFLPDKYSKNFRDALRSVRIIFP